MSSVAPAVPHDCSCPPYVTLLLLGNVHVSVCCAALDTIYCTPPLSGSTPQQLAQSFYAEVQRKAAFLASNVMFMPFGCDFAFQVRSSV